MIHAPTMMLNQSHEQGTPSPGPRQLLPALLYLLHPCSRLPEGEGKNKNIGTYGFRWRLPRAYIRHAYPRLLRWQRIALL